MGILHKAAQYRAYKEGVVHTTLNPKGPGSVRIHLIPPKWRLFKCALCHDIKRLLHIAPGLFLGHTAGQLHR